MQPSSSLSSPELPPELIAFADRKDRHARELAARFNPQLPPVIWAFFDAAKQGSWPEVARLGEELRGLKLPPEAPKPDPMLIAQVWSWIMEIYMAFAQFALGEPKYAFAFGRGIIDSIPPGSIYFGGTDPGRSLITALCRAHETGDPFFTLTQNSLVTPPYLRYLQAIYGHHIYVPPEQDLEQVKNDYFADYERRQKENKLLPGEKVEKVEGKLEPKSAVPVMRLNAALAKLVFDRNPDRQFFVEQSFTMDWMRPHLAPHGLILAVSRQPLSSIPAEAVQKDQAFWRDRLGQTLGDWLRPETPMSEVCAFAEKVCLRKDLAGFNGDPKYVNSEPACENFSNLRTSIAGLYAWRARTDSNAAERRRTAEAADFAYRQAFALAPRSLKVVVGLASHYLAEHQFADALRLAETACKLAPDQSQLQMLLGQIRNRQN